MGQKSPNNGHILENRDPIDQKVAEDAFRQQNLFYRIEVGTPWDLEGHLSIRGHMPRGEFVLEQPGVLTNEIAGLAAEIEQKIRTVLIPAWIALQEADEAERRLQHPVDTV